MGFNATDWNQNSEYILNPSYVESLMIPTKWVLKRMLLNDVDLTASMSDCSMDNYLNAGIIMNETNVPYLTVFFNEGASECESGTVNGAFVQALLEGVGGATVADGYQLGEGMYSFPVSSYQDVTGQSVEIKIQSDSLYYSASSNAGFVLQIYAPVY